MSEIWTKWEGAVVDRTFPLRRFLGGSGHGGVFLTEHKAQNLSHAAIKIIPDDPALTEGQLSHWRTAASLAHPHLIRLFDSGRCQLGGDPFLFVVMEYAEETLSQILPRRPLTPEEVREMLLPTLEALAFLHRNSFVQGHLQPQNFLVVEDQLKLASDNIRPAGESTTRIAKSSVYDPPEARNGRISVAADIWALGITLVEALTQSLPTWSDQRSETVLLPSSLPPAFVHIIRRCLSPNPADRPTIAALEAEFKGTSPAPVVSIPEPAVREEAAPAPVAPARKFSTQRLLVAASAVFLIVFAAIWAGTRLFRSSTLPERPPAGAVQPPSPPATPLGPSLDRLPPPLADASPSVAHQEIPVVPRSASRTIHGRFTVAVRVTVDGSGNVVGETMENPGPSIYFARLGLQAAKKWKFAPTDHQGAREWLLQFEFTRGGTTAHATHRVSE